jgi:tripartite-type tricarboxylate transporter receptor subunit TctC
MKRGKTHLIISFILILLLVTGLMFANGTQEGVSNEYPTEPIKLIVPFKVGGNMDIKARIISKYLKDEVGQPVVVVNNTGAGGVAGTTEYLLEKPNTHSLLYMVGSLTSVAPLFMDIQYEMDDFIPIIGVDMVSNGFFVNPEKSGINSLEDLIEYGKSHVIKFGSLGPGNDTYLVSKAFFEMAGVEAETITHGSHAQGLTNALAGHVDVTYSAMNLAKGYIAEGSLKCIGVFSDIPYTYYKGVDAVPTMKSVGIDMQYDAFSYFAIRKGSDDVIVQKLEKAFTNVFNNPSFQEEFSNAGYIMNPLNTSSEIKEQVEKLHSEVQNYYDLVK